MRSGRYFAYEYDTGNFPYSPINPYSQPRQYQYSTFGGDTSCDCNEPVSKRDLLVGVVIGSMIALLLRK